MPKIQIKSRDGEKIEFQCNSFDILAEDGRSLFEIQQDGSQIRIRAGEFCRHNGVVLDTSLLVAPDCTNALAIRRPPYE